MRIAHNASLESAPLPRRKASSSSAGMFLPLWNTAALIRNPAGGQPPGDSTTQRTALTGPDRHPKRPSTRFPQSLPRPAQPQHTGSPRQGNVCGLYRDGKRQAGRPDIRSETAERLPNIRTPRCRRTAPGTSDAPTDDPAEPVNAPVDDPTDQQATDPTNASMREAPGRGATTESAGQGNAPADVPVDVHLVKAYELTCTPVSMHFVTKSMQMDKHFDAVRRAGSRTGGRARAGEENSGERARQRPEGTSGRGRASARKKCVAGAPAPAVSRTPKAAQVSESGCVVEVVAACGCGHGRRQGELIVRIIKGSERVSISGEGAPAPDLPFAQISFRSLAAVGLLFFIQSARQGDRPARTSCSQIFGASLLAARAFGDRRSKAEWPRPCREHDCEIVIVALR